MQTEISNTSTPRFSTGKKQGFNQFIDTRAHKPYLRLLTVIKITEVIKIIKIKKYYVLIISEVNDRARSLTRVWAFPVYNLNTLIAVLHQVHKQRFCRKQSYEKQLKSSKNHFF